MADEQQKDATLDKVKADTSLQLKDFPVPLEPKQSSAMSGLVIQHLTYHPHWEKGNSHISATFNTLDAELSLS